MSVHWSGEMMKWEYRELQATAMSVDFTGNNVLLAGRRWLAIKQITLDEDPGEIVQKYPRQSKYDSAGAEWCQTYHGQRLCAISSNQRVDVYEWRNDSELTCICSLRGHTRVVSDTHFHRQNHNYIATCSIDTFTHIWDLRDVRKPAVSLCAVAGASQVQWNKVSPHLVATAHDGDIKIWDYRKNNAPIHYISAHLCKIHGVDWSPHHEYQLVTSSHDGSIKYFDINNARRPENTIMTNFPVWRAIYTPFGSGLLTIGVGWGGLPRVEQAGVIGIWIGGALCHRLVGHTDTVQTMVWRPNTSPANYQLVTWGRDQTLRLWSMHPSLLKNCYHYLPDDTDVEEDNASDTISYASTAGSVNDQTIVENKSHDTNLKQLTIKAPTTMSEEFESIKEMANIEVNMSKETRTCQIRSERNGYVANLLVSFPKNVSEQTIPKFSWLAGTNIDAQTTIKILQSINRTAHRKKREGQTCLLHCVKTLATLIDEIPVKPSEDSDSVKSSQRSQSESENAGDACIPFPRTCSAKWCGVDTLVVFNRPANARRLSLKPEIGTPRSMSSLSMVSSMQGYASVSPHATTTPSPTNAAAFPQLHHRASNSITTFYFQDRWKAQGRRTGSVRSRGSISSCSSPRVVLYEASGLFPISRTLAEKYIIRPLDPVEMCTHNEKVASDEGCSGAARSWALAALAARALTAKTVDHIGSSEESLGWLGHPLCCPMAQTLINHYAGCADVQMAAMLACAFPVFTDTSSSGAVSTISTSSYTNGTSSTYSNTMQQYSEVSADGWTLPVVHSNSCSDFDYMDSRLDAPLTCVLDDQTVHLYHCFKRVYADILHRWQLTYVRTEVMKLVRDRGESVSAGGLVTAAAGGPARCAVCALLLRGLAAICPVCLHAYHVHHARAWFSENETCPGNCGCKCLVDGSSTWKAGKF